MGSPVYCSQRKGSQDVPGSLHPQHPSHPKSQVLGQLCVSVEGHCRPVCCPGASHHQHLPLHHRDHPPHPLRPQERVRQAGESDVETEQGQVCSNSNSSCCQ